MSALSIESVGSVSTDIFLSFEILSVIVMWCMVCGVKFYPRGKVSDP